MQPGSSTERTPLVQPTYVFESSLTRRYQKRLRNFQCAICVTLMVVLAVSLLVAVSYNLSQNFDTDNSTDTSDQPIPQTPIPVNLSIPLLNAAPRNEPKTVSDSQSLDDLDVSSTPSRTLQKDTLLGQYKAVSADLQPLIDLKFPLKGKHSAPWVGDLPSTKDIYTAIAFGKAALKERKKLEKLRRPLDVDSPANRAQRAAATAVEVKPLADAAYAAEEATRALVNGTDISTRDGGVGEGPPTNGVFQEPSYCWKTLPLCTKSRYRTQDGTCNNLANPLRWGVSNTPFRRVLPPDYGDGISSPRTGVDGSPLPSARDVSVTVHRPSYAHDAAFTVMLAVWGQFIDHDITATALSKGENSSALSCCDESLPTHPECFPVPLGAEDPFYEEYNLTCMEFVRSASAPTCHFGPREQLNQATAFLDGSAVYGYGNTRAIRLRSGTGGLLRMLRVGQRELLPPSTDLNDGCNTIQMNEKGRYCFETGDDRANENLHLTTMHLIWARQHNRLAAALRKLNPTWDDETMYQEARKIVGAQIQHITYAEFLPAILGNDVMWALNLTLESEGHSNVYDSSVDPSVANHFAAAAFRFAHTLLPGLIHNVDSSTGSVSYIHLHEMLFNPYALYVERGARYAVRTALDTPVHLVDPHVTAELSNHLFERPIVMNTSDSTKKTGPCGLDLVSLNIQRGRDHGLPAYPNWRELCGFPRPKDFKDLEGVFDDSSLGRIKQIYSHVEDIDLYTGALAEEPRGRLLGPTLTCLIADQFLRLKVGDRFWYETSDHTVGFNTEQLQEIRKTTLASVICVNEELLEQAQPRVMEEVSATNPLVDCRELPQPSFRPWKQTNKR